MTVLFNRSLRSCSVPKCFKRATISPIPKCARPSHPGDYRPISLLPILSKVLERIVLRKCIFPYVHHKLDAAQFAYQPTTGTGTTSALTLLYHRVISFLDAGPGAVRIMTVDFKKAFEKLSHSTILASIAHFDLPAHSTLWINSFLSDRYQRVFTPAGVSPWTPVISGVPQGSVLGPILFCMALDGLRPCCVNTSIIKYADDVTFLHTIRDASEDRLQAEWSNLVNWSAANNLPINPEKCRVMDVITKKTLSLSPVKCNDQSCLPQVPDLFLLGVTISSNMKWDKHVECVLTKARKRIFVLRNLRKSGCPSHIMFQTYCALIRSLLLYAYPCFCNIPNRLEDKLTRFERRCFRIIGNDNFPSFLSVSRSLCLRLFQKVAMHDDHPLRELFLLRLASRTRSNRTLVPPRRRTKRFSSSFIKFALV